MRKTFARIHNGLAWALFIGCNLAFFLIALSVFGAASPEVHAWGGRILWFISLAMVIAVLLARPSGATIGMTILVCLLIFPGQGIFAYMDFGSRFVNALHAVNGLSIMWLSLALARGRFHAVRRLEQRLAPAGSD